MVVEGKVLDRVVNGLARCLVVSDPELLFEESLGRFEAVLVSTSRSAVASIGLSDHSLHEPEPCPDAGEALAGFGEGIAGAFAVPVVPVKVIVSAGSHICTKPSAQENSAIT